MRIANAKGQLKEIATGYELSRNLGTELADGTPIAWTERVLLVHSPAHALQQQRGLDQRLKTATEQLKALTPNIGRGKRQLRDFRSFRRRPMRLLRLTALKDSSTIITNTKLPSNNAKLAIKSLQSRGSQRRSPMLNKPLAGGSMSPMRPLSSSRLKPQC